ncbi:MAG: MarR family transcriptional regulator [Desulfobacteraceae bacterium]|nr:MarR family transcriptional regulator [Desulfobacteraceae bacterium]
MNNNDFDIEQEAVKQARYIMRTGKLIHDRVHRVFTTMAGNSSKLELSVPQMDAINAIKEKKEVTITKLSEMLGVSPPSTSAMVDRLVEKGILARERSREDRRKVVVSISKKAAEHIDKIDEAILKTFTELVEKVGPETARKWCEVLSDIKEVIRDKKA